MAANQRSQRLEFYQASDEDIASFRRAGEAVITQWEPKVGKEIVARLKALK